MTPYDLVLVRWHDARHPKGEWARASEFKADAADLEMLTCGHLVKRTPAALVIAVSASSEEDPQISGEMTLPAGCVIEVRVLLPADEIKGLFGQ